MRKSKLDMDDIDILREYEEPEKVQIPCPNVTVRHIDDVLEDVATHLNIEGTTIENLEGQDSEGPFTSKELRERLPEPLMASSKPLLSRITLTADMDNIDSEYNLEERVVDALKHEVLHIVLYHIEGRETSISLDELPL